MTISTFTAFVDANVFFGARLRSLLMELAFGGLFRARWSDHVHDEWMRSVVAKRPGVTLADLEPTRRAMDTAVPDAIVTGYEALVPALSLPDPDDRHVLAAAIVGHASVIVTFNEADFPASALEPFRLHTRHPDRFLLDVESIDPGTLAEAAIRDIAHYRDPPLSIDDYLADLHKAGVPGVADYLACMRILLEAGLAITPTD